MVSKLAFCAFFVSFGTTLNIRGTTLVVKSAKKTTVHPHEAASTTGAAARSCQPPNVANAEVKCANETTAKTLPSYEITCTVTCADDYAILDHTNEELVTSVDTVCLEDGVTRYHYDGQATEKVFSQQCTTMQSGSAKLL